jgi:hypothetical protein
MKMHDLNQKGIYTLQDLLNFGLENFAPLLLKQWQQVLFYEYKALQSTKYENTYSNPNYWEKLSYEGLKYHRNNLELITTNHPENIKNKISKLIQEKCEFLNTPTTEINPLHIRLLSVVSTFENENKNRRICKVTGLNISMQKEDSFLLSHTGLNYYFKTDTKIFAEVKRKYLTAIWKNEDHKKQIKEIAHNIRTTRTTQQRKQENLYHTFQPTLFNLDNFPVHPMGILLNDTIFSTYLVDFKWYNLHTLKMNTIFD